MRISEDRDLEKCLKDAIDELIHQTGAANTGNKTGIEKQKAEAILYYKDTLNIWDGESKFICPPQYRDAFFDHFAWCLCLHDSTLKFMRDKNIAFRLLYFDVAVIDTFTYWPSGLTKV